jgi:transmembrane sensor
MSVNSPFIPDVDLIDRYLAGELSPAEAECVHQWTTSRADRDALVEVLCAHARGVALERVIDVERGVRMLWHSSTPVVQERGGQARVAYPAKQSRGGFSGQPLRWRAWYALVGTTLATVALVVGWSSGILRLRDATQAPMLTYLTGPGERASITLPDGSTVALNVASRLMVPANYLAGNHTLRLEGEALFAVRHQLKTPVTVKAGTATARVLGTSFLVRHYATDTTILVAVREGRVAVQANQARTVVLTAVRQVTIGRATLRERETDPAAFSFATGVLTLTGGLFVDAIPELDRWYDADIRLGDSALVRRRLTGEYVAGSLVDLKDLLELTYHVRVVRVGRVLTLYRSN